MTTTLEAGARRASRIILAQREAALALLKGSSLARDATGRFVNAFAAQLAVRESTVVLKTAYVELMQSYWPSGKPGRFRGLRWRGAVNDCSFAARRAPAHLDDTNLARWVTGRVTAAIDLLEADVFHCCASGIIADPDLARTKIHAAGSRLQGSGREMELRQGRVERTTRPSAEIWRLFAETSEHARSAATEPEVTYVVRLRHKRLSGECLRG